MAQAKPLGCKAYGSIGHLPHSRLGPTDSSVPQGQSDICTLRVRDKHDTVIVQEKLDGSCTAVAKVGGKIIAIGRAGYLASTSRFEMHHVFAKWVASRHRAFDYLLEEGERVVGEWLAVAHGTIYDLHGREPWYAFDLMRGTERALHDEQTQRIGGLFARPHTLHIGGALSVAVAMERHEQHKVPCDETEGVVYRVERNGKVEFLAKWVRPTKVDGKYLPEISGEPAVWNWRPRSHDWPTVEEMTMGEL
jgi:hypothetical protein